MTEWWAYRPSDFLLFSPRTYYRLFELYNAEVWPAQLLTLGVGLGLWLALWRSRAWAPRAACALLAVAWLWVAWAFHWQRYQPINWAAGGIAVAFALQGVLLLAAAARAGPAGRATGPQGSGRPIGLGLLLFALVVQPALGALLGRPWPQAEVFGLAPDPTVLGTLGVLLLAPPRRAAVGTARPLPRATAWWLWPLPLLWCALSGATLATMNAADAWLLPGAALMALAAAWRAEAKETRRRRSPSARR